MIKRHLADYIKRAAAKYPVVTIVGPRQSGKSTLARAAFPNHAYVSLEEPDRREFALKDPRGFFKRFSGPLVIDEVQRAPELLSYIQVLVDEPGADKNFILTGSHQLLLIEKITQSLAGRTVITKLLPFSLRELLGRPAEVFGEKCHPAGKTEKGRAGKSGGRDIKDIEYYMFTGGYPRIYDRGLDAREWLQQYYMTYVERDVRAIVNVSQLDLFDRFVRLLAARTGSILNLSSLAGDCGISQPTARAWLSVLEACFICFTLRPHFKNFNKRLIKTPKIYFYDTGLLCYLLKIRRHEELLEHSMRGAIFENWVVAERLKSFFNAGEETPFYYWRDTKGHEVDLVLDSGGPLYPLEMKSSRTFNSEFIKSIKYLQKLQAVSGQHPPFGECVYAGDETFDFEDYLVRSWKDV
jgi:hypothetical protein